jgi:hypothetical protein
LRPIVFIVFGGMFAAGTLAMALSTTFGAMTFL